MIDMNQDPVGWLRENTPAPAPETQLDRIERMLTRLLAKSPPASGLRPAADEEMLRALGCRPHPGSDVRAVIAETFPNVSEPVRGIAATAAINSTDSASNAFTHGATT